MNDTGEATGRESRVRPLADETVRNVFHSVNDAISILDPETNRIIDVNETMCEMYGYSRDEARGLSIGDLSSGNPPYTEAMAAEYVEKAAEGNPQVIEWQAEDSGGELFWVEVSMRRSMLDGQIRILSIVRDITERKQYEERLKATTEDLEVLNRVIRHDIRNDMNAVLGWAGLLEDHVDEEGREYLRRVRTSSKNVVEITETARDYMRTLANEDDPPVAPTPLPPAIEPEIELRRELFPYAEFRLEGQIPDVTVTANEMLGTVFRNLLNNAVQHNNTGDPLVTVSCEATDGYVVVRIADNGSGIPDEQKDAVFRKGRKGADSLGSGIGLHLVRRLVEQYGGSVDVADNEPEGSVFSVRLPTAD